MFLHGDQAEADFIGGFDYFFAFQQNGATAFNGEYGVNLSGEGNKVRGNSIHSNGREGINESRCCNYPTLNVNAALVSTDTVFLVVKGGLGGGEPNAEFIIDIYSNPVCNDEGETYLDSVTVISDTNGDASFEALISEPVAVGAEITVTSTGPHGTREFNLACEQVVLVEPVPVDELRVRCTHSPIWPTTNATVTITAEALDASLNPVPLADNVEILVNLAPAASKSKIDRLEHTVGPFPSGSFSYGCRVHEGGGSVFSGYRTVTASNDPGVDVPVLYNGPSTHKIDIVFIADGNSYGPPTNPDFINDVETVIKDAYFAEPLFLENQSSFNFWIAGRAGGAGGYQKNFDPTASEDEAGPDTCDDGIDNGGEGVADTNDRDCISPRCILNAPPGWDDDLAFADAGAILHTQGFRDCASGGLFSSDSDKLRTVIHESGHRPFGLRDEYCCDGGYGQSPTLPNLYKSLNACVADAPDVGRSGGDCHKLTRGGSSVDWWTSDPASDDLMVDNRTPSELDIRRIEWLFESC